MGSQYCWLLCWLLCCYTWVVIGFRMPITSAPLTLLNSKVRPNVHSRPDNFVEKAIIRHFAKIIASIAPEEYMSEAFSHISPNCTFEDCVETTKVLLKAYPKEDVSLRVWEVLRRMAPRPFTFLLGNIARWSPKWAAELSSYFMSFGFFSWLVGPSERFDIPLVIGPSNDTQIWKSGTKLPKCRYLDVVGCKTACLHLCKVPTEKLFNEDIGLPMYMKPNFTDNSCELFFGIAPPARDDDPAFKESCDGFCRTISIKEKDANSGENTSSEIEKA